MSNATKAWLHGLGSAVIGGAASAVTVVIVDPATFNLSTGGLKLLSVLAVSGIISAALYLKQSPLPPDTAPASIVQLPPTPSNSPTSTGEPK